MCIHRSQWNWTIINSLCKVIKPCLEVVVDTVFIFVKSMPKISLKLPTSIILSPICSCPSLLKIRYHALSSWDVLNQVYVGFSSCHSKCPMKRKYKFISSFKTLYYLTVHTFHASSLPVHDTQEDLPVKKMNALKSTWFSIFFYQ